MKGGKISRASLQFIVLGSASQSTTKYNFYFIEKEIEKKKIVSVYGHLLGLSVLEWKKVLNCSADYTFCGIGITVVVMALVYVNLLVMFL